MLEAGSLSPLYTQVANVLRERIVAGLYQPLGAIPSQAELVEEFGVSPITVRRAIRELTFEGLLFSRQGLGVFVADRRKIVRTLSTGPFAPLRDDILRAGMEPTVKELSFGRCEPDQETIARLKLKKRAALYEHEKIIFADNVPIAIDTVHLPARLALMMRTGLAGDFIFELLPKLGIKFRTIARDFEGCLATPREADLLGGAPPLPLIVARYVIYDEGNAPILSGRTAARTDRMRFEITTRS